jgi:hypothetical protein
VIAGDPDLIVPHLALPVSDMEEAKARMRKVGVQWRTNITVPDEEGGIIDQAFVRDPDGHYIELNNDASGESDCNNEIVIQDTVLELVKRWIRDAKEKVKKEPHIANHKILNLLDFVQYTSSKCNF